MKIVFLTSEAPNQHALAAKVAASFDLAGMVVEIRPSNKKRTVKIYYHAILDRFLFFPLRNAWASMQQYYKINYRIPSVSRITVSNINNKETIDFISRIKPDIIMVSGTSMLKQPLLSLQIPLGIINLHTGISPYIKGGPNCTNWCLATAQFHLIGNTVMWLNEGIDSGDIIATEITPVDGNESLEQLHLKVMEHAHDLYIRCLKLIETKGRVKGVPQKNIAEGVTYFTRQWQPASKMKALLNFRKWRTAQREKAVEQNITLVNPF